MSWGPFLPSRTCRMIGFAAVCGMITVKMLSKQFILVALLVAALLVFAMPRVPSVSLADQPDYEGLHKADPVARARAVQAIRQARDVQAVPLLLDQINDPDPAVGLYVAQALGDLATVEALAWLRADLQHPDPNVRFRAALALGKRSDIGATSALTRALRDPDVLVHRTAAEALAQIGTPDAIDSLVSALNSEQDSIIHNAMGALQVVGDPAAPSLVGALGSPNPMVRQRAATVLGYIKSPLAIPALEAVAADRDPDVAKEAVWALAEIPKRR
jgi:HEAT repeat protein